MVVIEIKKEMLASPQQLLAILTDHDQLFRFFNGRHVVIKGSDASEISGGKGCRRQVTMFGQTFIEEIEEANLTGIKYSIVGSKPLKHHQGRITFEVLNEKTLVNYYVKGIAPNHLPEFLVQFAIKRTLQRAMKKLAQHFV